MKLINIDYSYGRNKVLNKLNFEFSDGKVYAILGHNGAGKTTLFKLIIGVKKPQNGKVEQHFETISYLPENDGLYEDLTCIENIDYRLALNQSKETSKSKSTLELLDELNLLPYLSKKVSELSQGLKKRLAIACSLISTHNLDFVMRVCDEYLILQNGIIVHSGLAGNEIDKTYLSITKGGIYESVETNSQRNNSNL